MKNGKEASKRVDIISIKMIRESSKMYPERKIKDPLSAVELIKDLLVDRDREHMVVAYLNTKNEPIAIQTIGIGTLNSILIHPREVFKAAILCNASAFLLAHNHPSGDVTPSVEDRAMTARLQKSGELIGINVLDHIIINDSCEYYSFKENEDILSS